MSMMKALPNAALRIPDEISPFYDNSFAWSGVMVCLGQFDTLITLLFGN